MLLRIKVHDGSPSGEFDVTNHLGTHFLAGFFWLFRYTSKAGRSEWKTGDLSLVYCHNLVVQGFRTPSCDDDTRFDLSVLPLTVAVTTRVVTCCSITSN